MAQIRLAAHVTGVVQQRKVLPLFVIGLERDSCATNGAACRRLAMTYPAAANLLCIAHTLCHVGERFELDVLDEFMTPGLDLVWGRAPHHGAKDLWKETVAPATTPGYSNIRWYAKAEIEFVIAEAGTRRLRDFLYKCQERDYGEATTKKMIKIYEEKGEPARLGSYVHRATHAHVHRSVHTHATPHTHHPSTHTHACTGELLRLQLAGMLDMRIVVSSTYELEGDRLEILLVFDRVEALRALGRALRNREDGILPNADAVLRRLMELKKGVKFEKFFHGHGIATGKLDKLEKVDSTLYQGQERDAWLVKYEDGHEEHFEEEELRSGKDGPAPAGQVNITYHTTLNHSLAHSLTYLITFIVTHLLASVPHLSSVRNIGWQARAHCAQHA